MSDFPPLADDETLLWEGKPDTRLRFGIETMATGIFAVALILACLGLATVINRSEPGYFWPILAPGIGVGAVIVLAHPILDSFARRKIRYRLTSQRAILRGPLAGPKTDLSENGYPIPPMEDLIYADGAPPSIYFGKRPTSPGAKGQRITKDVGFERIVDAREVFIMMRGASENLHS